MTAAVPESLTGIWSAGDSERTAIVVPEDGLRITYGELGDRIDELARTLAGLGVERGDRVCLALPNGPEIVELLLAAAAMGAAAAPLNPAYTPDEFAFYLDDLEPQLLLVPEGRVPAAREAAASRTRVVDVGPDARVMTLGGPTRGEEYRPGTADDIALLLHTSGTTSRPKQVPLLQRNLVASARSMVRHYRLTEEDASGVVMPLFHVHGLVATTFASLAAGGQVVLPRRVAPGPFWRLLSGGQITWFSAGPTVHQMLLKGARRGGSGRGRLRFARSCSSPLSRELMASAEETYGVPLLEAYGMTEASHEMAANPLPPGERRPGTVGIPTGCRIRVVDDRWDTLTAGTAGEVAVLGPGLTPGYLGNPQANRESFRDGWFRTGDIGVVEDGYLRLVGRIKELIIRGGENVSPGEVEEVLKQHAAVEDAAVFGIPDEKYGELVAAAVSLSSDVDEQTLIRHCRSRLTAVKVPARISVLDEIPRTPTGKLQRRRVASLVT